MKKYRQRTGFGNHFSLALYSKQTSDRLPGEAKGAPHADLLGALLKEPLADTYAALSHPFPALEGPAPLD